MLTDCRIYFKFRKFVFRFILFILQLFRLHDTNLKHEVRVIVVMHSSYVYKVKVCTYSYNTLRRCTKKKFPPHIRHFESCSFWGIESRKMCHFESYSLRELLILRHWIKNCRPYEPSFTLTQRKSTATQFSIFCGRPCCLRCSTSP